MSRVAGLVTAGCLVLTGLVASPTVPAVGAAGPADGTLTVRLVRDVNGNGSYEPALEVGVPGVPVTVTDPAGGTATGKTGPDGVVKIDLGPVSGGRYRVDAAIPSTMPHLRAAPTGSDKPGGLSGLTEFVSGPNPSITMGVWNPSGYCQANPVLATACQRNISKAGNDPAARSLVTFPFTARGGTPPPTAIAKQADTGSVFGLAYRKQDKRLFSGAFAKRLAPYGPGGSGAIYATTPAGTTSQFATVPGAGVSQHSDGHDGAFFAVPGKEGLGDLEMSEDGTALYAVNLADRKLYVFDATVPAASAPVGSYDIPASGCANAADWRPSALATQDGVLYVGGVCAGQDLKAVVLPFQKSAFGGAVITKKLGAPWHAWLDRWELGKFAANGGDVAYAQPFLANMAVEGNGDVVLALRDRFGDQLGQQTQAPNGNGAYNAVVAGTLERGCKQECTNPFKDTKGAMGAVALVPGSAKLPVTALGGTTWLDRASAGPGGGTYQVGDKEGWGKANSLADLEALCDLAPLQLGSRVWFDVDKDGVQDGNEPPLEGVKVTAAPCAGGAALPAQTTNAKGEYTFSAGLRADTCYNLKFDVTGAVTSAIPGTPPGPSLKWTARQAGPNRAADSNVDPGTGLATVTTGGAGSVDTTVDAGLTAPTSALGDLVWMDNNRNGMQDPGEPGVPGVTVTAGSRKTVTGPDGKYLLGELPDGSYEVCFSGWPTGYLPAVANVGSDNADSDADAKSGCAPPVTVGPAKREDLTVDFGIRPPNRLGDVVWSDLNRNGLFDADEPPVPGVTVTTGSLTTVTGVDGKYVFDKLPDGTYTVCFDLKNLPSAYLDFQPTRPDQGGDDALDSDADLVSGCSAPVTLNAGSAENLSVDAGLVSPVNRIGDFAWSDLNGDGRQDPGEPGLAGVQVTMGARQAITAADGRYVFEGMPDGKYVVCFTPFSDYQFVTPNTGDDAKNSDADQKSGCAPEVTVGPGNRTVMTVDAGFTAPEQSIGDLVWSDANRNGLLDTGEPGVPGVTVTAGALKATTGADGKYLFTRLPEGEHTVCFTAPGDLQFTKPNAGDDGMDSDADPASGCAAPVRLGPGNRSVHTVDAGLSAPANRIGDLVWADTNRNGRYDSGEPGVAGVAVTAGSLKTTTGADGKYLLSEMPDGKYKVCFAVEGYKLGAGVDQSGCAPEVTVGPGSRSVLTVDLGLLPPPNKVGDLVWRDTNRNGVLDQGEPGVPGVTVTTGAFTTVTGRSGEYLFPDLGDGKHVVCFTLKDDLQLTKPFAGAADKDSNADPASRCAPPVTLGPGNREDLTVDAGLMSPMNRIGGVLWLDRNRNGAQDAGEQPAPGVQVTLGGTRRTSTTDASGRYLFDDLPDGTHQVCFGGHQDFTAACAPDVALGVGKREVLQVNAGLTAPPNRIGDLVWLDANRNGTHDPGEQGLPGIAVFAGATKTVTDAAGKYLFDDVPDGAYRICFDVPKKYLFTQADGCADTVTVGPGKRSVLSVDAGLRPPNRLGGMVWLDTNGNGVAEPDEKPVTGHLVTVGTHKVLTGPDGRYVVEDLPDGRYTACFARYGEHQAVAVDPQTWCTAPTRLYADKWEDLALNVGLVSPRNRIGDYVWLDRTRDGLQDPGESGAANVTVILQSADAKEMRRAATDRNGRYLFDGLPDGSYTVCLPKTELKGYVITGKDAGEDSRDSDVDQTNGCGKPITVGVVAREVLTADIGLMQPKALAKTGSSLGWLITGGIGILAIGLLLLLSRRRTE
nr:SdrD B-like domain-containing protein [Kibdelosporangium sp. MJ126-NF4]CEL15671.1 FIG00503626: hypothetical protein [Kibdelosporangium sp. MJ126-NF4]CTQ93596.1 FIG00503626: hypothetical protein [Kibdelosporangium sp. MJ126-NF4]